ncbi:MAG TPA: phospholipase [Cryomorphaceae bacterium]|nr:phospholipase [Owenweeksia sp.]MBF99006.1 phospholipase [Owenweeksia sp.]HAD97068.1 phospholipase [Cryomorphaceae bacterium]HBF19826.1 phospholipase [Cryomorphaceae bacterium]HCQ15221.1 phospholipase [Cryomorphaceae bacterium]|tara:strand:- start:712 stop:1482 length:771 start_codon:yes stop_codon:yes gene_type:complete
MNKLVLLVSIMVHWGAFAQNEEFKREVFVHDGDSLLYRVLWPENFDADEKYPVVLFLHGAGERGNDNQTQLVHGSKLFRDSIQKYPAIVIFPQCPQDDYWANVKKERNDYGYHHYFSNGEEPTPSMKLLMALVDSVVLMPYVNTNRIYVGGLSMGGMGTFEIVYRMPDMFAAAFPICGGGNMESAAVYAKKVPFWIFHGAQDDIVLPYHSIKMRKAIADAGGDVELTIYPNANHNSWDPAFAEPGLLKWIFSHSKK